jgi:hypothetical protein
MATLEEAAALARDEQGLVVVSTLRADGSIQPSLVNAGAEQVRLLLRAIFTSAGGSHDDWDEYDRVMAEQRRTAVLIRPTRVYSN